MTQKMLVVLGVLIAAGSLLDAGPAAGQLRGRVLTVGNATVVVARSAGGLPLAAPPRRVAVPRFRALSTQSRAALMKAAQEIIAASPDGVPISRISSAPGGVTLVTARPAGPLPPVATARRRAVPAFTPLSAAAKAAVLRGIADEIPAPEVTPPAAESPFTLTPANLRGPNGRAWLEAHWSKSITGEQTYIEFATEGTIAVTRASSETNKQYMLHFQVTHGSPDTFYYTFMTPGGIETKVSAGPQFAVQDIVVFVYSPPTGLGTGLATLTAKPHAWNFLGVEITPM